MVTIVTPMEFMTDAGGGEMDSQNGDAIIGPQIDPNSALVATTGSMQQDADMEEDEARSEATFRFSVQHFSKLKVSAIRMTKARQKPLSLLAAVTQRNIVHSKKVQIIAMTLVDSCVCVCRSRWIYFYYCAYFRIRCFPRHATCEIYHGKSW